MPGNESDEGGRPNKCEPEISLHHILPSSRISKNSRCEPLKDDSRRRLYTSLFEDRSPEESLVFLVNYFWDGYWDYVYAALLTPPRKGQRHEIVKLRKVIIQHALHMKYHHIFFNATPPEIISRLVTHYWDGEWSIVEKFVNKKLETEGKEEEIKSRIVLMPALI